VLQQVAEFARTAPRRAILCCLWLAGGLLCIGYDEQIQPQLTDVGRSEFVRPICEIWQDLGATPGIVVFIAVGLLASCADKGRTALRFIATVAAAGVVVQIVKHVAGRARPNWVHDTTHFYGPFGVFNSGSYIASDSMPSGHTAAAFAMAVALSNRWPQGRFLWFVLAAGVGASRTLVDRHFPSDVLLGALLGTIVGLVVYPRVLPGTVSDNASSSSNSVSSACHTGEHHETQGD
jgi:membrane-associated phospholipid phosphatase